MSERKIIFINSVYEYGSTGNLIKSIVKSLTDIDVATYVLYGRKKLKTKYKENIVYISNPISIFMSLISTRLFSVHNFLSIIPTLKAIRIIKNIKPDIVNLHNLHGYYINVGMLLRYINKKNIKVIWTIHDQWLINEKLRKTKIPYINFINLSYPKVYGIEFPRINRYLKNKWVRSIKNGVFVFPSKWMLGQFSNYHSNVDNKLIHNGIDTNIFKPIKQIPSKFDFLKNKKIILSIANKWTKSKGIDFINDVISRLSDDALLIIVGEGFKTNNKNVLQIDYVKDKRELNELYNLADVFFNPTLVDNFPTVNMESLASGTPVIAFDTGGNSEIIVNGNSGFIIEKNIDDFFLSFEKILNNKSHFRIWCRKFAVDSLKIELMQKKYKKLFEESLQIERH